VVLQHDISELLLRQKTCFSRTCKASRSFFVLCPPLMFKGIQELILSSISDMLSWLLSKMDDALFSALALYTIVQQLRIQVLGTHLLPLQWPQPVTFVVAFASARSNNIDIGMEA